MAEAFAVHVVESFIIGDANMIDGLRLLACRRSIVRAAIDRFQFEAVDDGKQLDGIA